MQVLQARDGEGVRGDRAVAPLVSPAHILEDATTGVNVTPGFVRQTMPILRSVQEILTPPGPLVTPRDPETPVGHKAQYEPPLITPHVPEDPPTPAAPPARKIYIPDDIKPTWVTPRVNSTPDVPGSGPVPHENPPPGNPNQNTGGAGLAGNGALIDALMTAFSNGGFQSPMDATSSPGAAAVQALQPQAGNASSSGNTALVLVALAAVGAGAFFIFRNMKKKAHGK